MPARSNSFQRLVRAIQGHLSRAGTVTESRFLNDRDTGSPVEVDIVIEEVVGGHTVLVGVECTAGKRKATIEWYREMRSKHADLPISKTVLVSESGFTQQVYRKARRDGITLLSLGEAQNFKWQDLFAKLSGGKLADVSFALRSVELLLRARAESPPTKVSDFDLIVHGPGFEAPLGLIAMTAAKESGATKAIMANLGAVLKRTDHAFITFRLPAGSYVIVDGMQTDLLEVKATFSIHPKYRAMEWRPIDFNGQTVAATTFPADFLFPGTSGESVLTISQDASDEMKVRLLGPSDEDIPLEVFPNALWQPATAPDVAPPKEDP